METRRWHGLDALRAIAMLLGIVLHASLAFFPTFWPVQDVTSGASGPYDTIFYAIHGFRMPVFFLLSGFFTAMLWRRRGLRALLKQRAKRILVPLAIGVVTLVPLMNLVANHALTSQSDSLLIATFTQNEHAVEMLLDDGADPNAAVDDAGNTPLHLAALADNAAIAELLLDAGANPVAIDAEGVTPLGYAYYAGSEDVADLLVAAGHPDIREPGTEWRDLPDWGFGEAEAADIFALDTWLSSLHHLWFLWFLVLYVAGFAIVAAILDRRGKPAGSRPRSTTVVLWSLVPLSLVAQYWMGGRGATPVYGPDTSAGFVPVPHVLAYYAAFFAFGALVYGRTTRRGRPLIESIGRPWPVLLPVAAILFPVGLHLTFVEGSWPAAALAQGAFAWVTCLGLIGLFVRAFGRESRSLRYLSDSAYWLYLFHLPLLIWVQTLTRDWSVPSGVKFVGDIVAVTAFLLVTYQLFVRYTPIGTVLNGKRTRPNGERNPRASGERSPRSAKAESR